MKTTQEKRTKKPRYHICAKRGCDVVIDSDTARYCDAHCEEIKTSAKLQLQGKFTASTDGAQKPVQSAVRKDVKFYPLHISRSVEPSEQCPKLSACIDEIVARVRGRR